MNIRSFCLVLCSMAAINIFAQDQSKDVTLSVNQQEPVILDLNDYQLSIRANDYGNGTEISIDIKNNPLYHLFLFDRAYTEKELKKMKPSIRFDKKFYGATSRDLLICKALQDDGTMQITPDGNRSLTFKGITGERAQCLLPLYVVKFKKKGFLRKAKYLIYQRVKIELNITLQTTPKIDDDYERVSKACEDLIEEIGQLTFCDRKSHKPSYKEQIEPYETKIQDLKDEISDIKSANRWREKSPEYQQYKELIAKLEEIEFKKQYCGSCGIKAEPDPRHRHCAYCDKTTKQVWQQLDKTYKKIDNRQQKKSDALSSVNALHKAWTGGCPNLTRRMKEDPTTKANIEDLYNDIVNY